MKKLYKFYADWCGPCKSLSSIIDQVEMPDDVELIDMNVDEEGRDMAQMMGVRSIPTMCLVDSEGKLIATKVGMMNKEQFLEFVETR